MRKILIVEDDKDVRCELKNLLEKNGYEANYLEQFDNACEDILEYNADLILLDCNLPCINGENLLREIRKKSNVLVIMVTSKNTEMDELLCMSFGADDFITKPYNPSILLLHIEAMFKRMNLNENVINYENLSIDIGRGTITAQKTIELSKNEMKILVFLVKNKGSIVSRYKIIEYLWEEEEFVDDNTLTVNMTRLRKKLEEVGMKDVIKTKRGQGYVII